jgi:molybdate transport system substrate-binding protein
MIARSLLLAWSLTSTWAGAEELRVAVAANFRDAFVEVSKLYEQHSGTRPDAVFGSSGMLYAQITQGAPFHLFLSADRKRPLQLETAGLTASPVITYARGRLALWMPERDASPDALAGERFALANPQLAPYGEAARACLERLGLWQANEANAIYGNNVSQTFHFVASGAVGAGLVAYAQLLSQDVPTREFWLAPDSCYEPIDQGVVVLKSSFEPEAARFMTFLLGPEVQERLAELGYASP